MTTTTNTTPTLNIKKDTTPYFMAVALAIFILIPTLIIMGLLHVPFSERAEQAGSRWGENAHLVTDDEPTIRSMVAWNEHTAPETLDRLASDKVYEVRLFVATNPTTAPHTLAYLAEDTDAQIRQVVARNPSTPAEALLRLADDEEQWVRHFVNLNPNYKRATTTNPSL